jgi:hypothetical protein
MLYGHVISFAICPGEFMLWCPLMLSCGAKLEDDGVQ